MMDETLLETAQLFRQELSQHGQINLSLEETQQLTMAFLSRAMAKLDSPLIRILQRTMYLAQERRQGLPLSYSLE
jgi:hypothetical protein